MALYELDEFKPGQFLGFVRSLPAPAAFKGVNYLPNRVINDLAFEYVLGAYRRPVMAHVMGYDSEAPLHGRRGSGAKVEGELPPIKRKRRIGEKEILRFLTPRAGTTDQQEAVNSVYVDTAELLDTIQARVEWLRMQALSEDTVLYDESGVTFSFDFGFDNEFQINLAGAGGVARDGAGVDVSSEFGDPWTAIATANPVLDGQAIVNRVREKTGRTLAKWVMSQTKANLLYNNAAMKNMIRGSSAPDAILTQQEVNTLFSLYGIPPIETYDVVLQKENADGTYSDVRPLASNKSFLLPEGFGEANRTLWGPTAESRVLYGTALAGQAPGIWAETYGTTEPPAEYTKAAATAFPTIPEANVVAQVQLA